MKPNILFLVIDGLRADRCFGKSKSSITPNIDKLIHNGVYFNQTIASGQSSTPSVSSIFTSLYPFECLAQDGKIFVLNTNHITHIQKLRKNGYKIHAMVQDALEHIGFKEIFGEDNLKTYDHAETKLWAGLGDDVLTEIEKISKNQPWFFYLQLYDLNLLIYPYDERFKKGPNQIKNPKFGQNHYERIISALDIWIGKIIEKIDLKSTLVILTSDHGLESGAYNEKLQEFDNSQRIKRMVKPGIAFNIAMRGKSIIPFRKKFAEKYKKHTRTIKENIQIPELEKIEKLELPPYEKRLMRLSTWYKSNVYDDRLHVPLIFCGHNTPSGKIVSKLSRSVDIFPTIFDMCNLSFKIENRGKSLRPLMFDKNFNETPVFIESTVNFTDPSDSNLVGLRTSEFKYFRDRKNPLKNVHLYNLVDDPKEEYDISMKNPETVQNFENELIKINYNREFVVKENDDNEIGIEEAKEIERKLKEAGYIN